MYVKLGNVAAISRGEGIGEEVATEYDDGPHVTTIPEIPEGTSLIEVVTAITKPGDGLWASHSTEPPAWVASDSEALEEMLAEHWGCARGEPDDLEETHTTPNGPPGIGPDHEGTFVGEDEETPSEEG